MNTNTVTASQTLDNDAWLAQVADKLEAEGNAELAAQARAEIGQLAAQRAARTPVAPRCDTCGAVVRGAKRRTRFADVMGVDWALCAKHDNA